jgi:radical SAM superfamily enzyme YgiQ (UPF0313 family)
MVDNYNCQPKTAVGRSLLHRAAKAATGPIVLSFDTARWFANSFGEDMPLIIGGVEASLRRFAHYDYWSGKVRRSILQDSQADILVYGMGELPLLEIARLLAKGVSVHKINSVRGTCVLLKPDKLAQKLS